MIDHACGTTDSLSSPSVDPNVKTQVSPHLEVADLISGAYVLEVSSPGIQRPLKRAADFERFRDQRVVVKLAGPVDGRRTFRGVNRGTDEDGNLLVDDRETGKTHALPLDLLRKAHLDPELKF